MSYDVYHIGKPWNKNVHDPRNINFLELRTKQRAYGIYIYLNSGCYDYKWDLKYNHVLTITSVFFPKNDTGD